jgi:POT family proton-dependent oligopeptide transporter
MAKTYATVPPEIETMPKGIPYIIGNEAAERFSYYGMNAFLVVFMTQHLLNSSGEAAPFSDAKATEWAHYFKFGAYLFPILGAIFSDWLIGKYRMIISLSMVYCAGHAVLALIDSPVASSVEPPTLLALGLFLIAVGAGGIKPCVSAHVGDQFGAKSQHLLSTVYGWFYFSINFGSTFSTMLTPWLLEEYGPGWAFGVPGVLMAIATFVFWMGRNKFVHVPPSGKKFFEDTFSPEGLRVIRNLIPLYFFIMMFWVLFDQTMSTWVLQAKKMDRVLVDTNLFGQDIRWEILESQVQTANPLFVMMLIPVFTFGVYPLMGRFFKVTPLRKIGIGLAVAGLSFVVVSLIETRITAGEKPSIYWQFLAYFIITCAEVMVSITGLEFSYTQAPKTMKSFIMGLFLLSVAFANLLVAQVNGFIDSQMEKGVSYLQGANYFWFFTACMAVMAVLYIVWSQFYSGHSYIQSTKGTLPGDDINRPT